MTKQSHQMDLQILTVFRSIMICNSASKTNHVLPHLRKTFKAVFKPTLWRLCDNTRDPVFQLLFVLWPTVFSPLLLSFHFNVIKQILHPVCVWHFCCLGQWWQFT